MIMTTDSSFKCMVIVINSINSNKKEQLHLASNHRTQKGYDMETQALVNGKPMLLF
jgi:hypothetical protein